MTTRLERRVKSWDEIAPTRPPTSNPFRLLVDGECQLRQPNSICGSAWLSLFVALHSKLVEEWVAQVIGSIPKCDQKDHTYTCFARSVLCTGNLDDLSALDLI